MEKQIIKQVEKERKASDNDDFNIIEYLRAIRKDPEVMKAAKKLAAC
tara:strand:+ start:500 stop:640 length:141 start_codon:yes stop_codon:yes gene_type:complete